MHSNVAKEFQKEGKQNSDTDNSLLFSLHLFPIFSSLENMPYFGGFEFFLGEMHLTVVLSILFLLSFYLFLNLFPVHLARSD